MVKINEFHVGKNDVNSRGVWTHICPEKEKNVKKVTLTGFDPRTFRFQVQNTTSELRWPVTLHALKKLIDSYTYDTVLANFSQFPPISASIHLYSTNLDLFRQLFHLHDLGVVWCSLFENILFWLYFLSRFINSNFFCGRLLDFCYIFVIYLDFFVSRSKL